MAIPNHALALATALALGTLLRLYQITRQVVCDDEWHAIAAAASTRYRHLVSHFGVADYSIPLAVLDKLALDTFGLSEMVMRAPVLLFGLGSLVVFPFLVRDLVGRPAAGMFALLLAVSPLHVYFSRYARPYSGSVLFSFVAAVAFYRWWSGAGPRWGHLYALSAGVGTWFHLTVAPAAVAPLAFAAAARIRRAGHGRPSKEIVKVALETAIVLGSLLAAPLWVDRAALSAKTGRASVELQTVVGAAQLMGGTRHAWLIAALLIATVCGVAVLARTRMSLVIYGVTLSLAQIVAVLLLQPAAVRNPIVLARYALPILPWLLLVAAAGLVAVQERITSPHGAAGLIVIAAVAATLLAAGPLPAIYYHPNNWTNHAVFQYVYDSTSVYNRRYRLPPPSINPFYLRLANEPPASLTLLEAPWRFESSSNVYPFYQRVHRQWMIVGFVRSDAGDGPAEPFYNELPPAQAKHFRNFVHVGSHAEIAARGVDYAVFHKDLAAELPASMQRRSAASVTRWIEEYRNVHGPPVYEDAAIAVFDVTK